MEFLFVSLEINFCHLESPSDYVFVHHYVAPAFKFSVML